MMVMKEKVSPISRCDEEAGESKSLYCNQKHIGEQ